MKKQKTIIVLRYNERVLLPNTSERCTVEASRDSNPVVHGVFSITNGDRRETVRIYHNEQASRSPAREPDRRTGGFKETVSRPPSERV